MMKSFNQHAVAEKKKYISSGWLIDERRRRDIVCRKSDCKCFKHLRNVKIWLVIPMCNTGSQQRGVLRIVRHNPSLSLEGRIWAKQWVCEYKVIIKIVQDKDKSNRIVINRTLLILTKVFTYVIYTGVIMLLLTLRLMNINNIIGVLHTCLRPVKQISWLH